jgi:hypothetical protein
MLKFFVSGLVACVVLLVPMSSPACADEYANVNVELANVNTILARWSSTPVSARQALLNDAGLHAYYAHVWLQRIYAQGRQAGNLAGQHRFATLQIEDRTQKLHAGQ